VMWREEMSKERRRRRGSPHNWHMLVNQFE
jgi:hypothetical protein